MMSFTQESRSSQTLNKSIPAVRPIRAIDRDNDFGPHIRQRSPNHSNSIEVSTQVSLVDELKKTVGLPDSTRNGSTTQTQDSSRHLSVKPVEDLRNSSPTEYFSFYEDPTQREPSMTPSSRSSNTFLSPNRFAVSNLFNTIRGSGQPETQHTGDLLGLAPPTTPPSDRGSIELLEAVQFSDDNGKSKRLELGKAKNPVDLLKSLHGQAKNLPNLWRKGTDNIGDVVGNVKGDVLDLTMVTRQGMGKGTEGLCAACCKMPFEQFKDSISLSPNVAELESEFVRPLEGILKNRDWCRFCRIVFRALCLPHNDPLMSPQIQNYIQEDLRGKSFGEWASRANWMLRTLASQKIWPFGHSRDSKEAEAAMNSGRFLSDFASAGTVAATQMVKDEHQARVLATVNAAVYSAVLEKAMEKRPLPCWVMIKMNNRGHAASGVLSIDVFSYGRAARAPLSRLSQFSLRVASEGSNHPSGFGLRYGRILDKHQIDLGLGKMCLANCEQAHGAVCSSPSWSRQLKRLDAMGFRVIDVQEERLVELQPYRHPEYVCLSYVWGKYETIKLNSGNLKQLSTARALSQTRAGISNTIRAAMEVVREIGKRYLWVDSLCIKQDDEIEKKSQIMQMDRIYGYAVVTIVAADGLSADSGLVGVTYSRSRNVDQIAEEVRPGVNVLIPLSKRQQLNPWDSRAWTLQEKLLSRRLLIFSGGHMVWHCRRGVACEDMTEEDSGLRQTEIGWLSLPEQLGSAAVNFQLKTFPDGSSRLIRPKLFSEYVKLVGQYTHRKMTVAADVLNAIQGLLKILESSRSSSSGARCSSGSLYGLMEEYLDAALLWQPEGAENVRLQRRRIPGEGQMPSWSWAGWEAVEEACYVGGVRYEDSFQVLTDNDGHLMKVLQENGEERTKPLLRWYMTGKSPPPVPKKGPNTSGVNMARSPGPSHTRTLSFPNSLAGTRSPSPGKQLKPMNGNGSGLMLETNEPHGWSKVVALPALESRDVSDDVMRNINNSHLVFKTAFAQFRLGNSRKRTEIIYRREASSLREDHRLQIFETEIINARSEVVGWVILHDPKSFLDKGRPYDFILISEAQYFGDENRVDIMGFPLYNIMLITWTPRRPFAERVALGKVYQHAWRNANPHEELIVLG